MGFLLLFFALGMLLDAVAIFCITLPVIFPVVGHVGFNPIWFGIIAVKMCEIGLVTPPVGMNVYVCTSAAGGQVSLSDTFRGVMPFVLCDVFVLILLITVPQICLYLPSIMFQ